VVARQFEKDKIEIKEPFKIRLKAALAERVNRLTQPKEVDVDINRFADDLSKTTVRMLVEEKKDQKLDPDQSMKIEKSLRENSRMEFLKLRTPPPRLNVLVTTQEIREAATSDSVTRIRISLSEQAMEWTMVESGDQTQERLVPE